MLTSEETTLFLETSKRLSEEMAAQAQFVRDTFLPHIDAFNQHVSDRLHMPSIARDVLSVFMRDSVNIPVYSPRKVAHNYNNGTPDVLAIVHKEISSKTIKTCIFPSGVLMSTFGDDTDFQLYFDTKYKAQIIYYDPSKPVVIYTNFDFLIEIVVNPTKYSETKIVKYCGRPDYHSAASHPLSGHNFDRSNFDVKFVSLTSTPLPVARPLLNPSDKELMIFLSQRKPYIHPVVVLDYLREQPLSDIRAFFGDVSAYDLLEAKNEVNAEKLAHAQTSAKLSALLTARTAEAAVNLDLKAKLEAAEQVALQHRTKQNDAALRIKRLQMKLAQTEKLYEDLQLRLIEEQGLGEDDDGEDEEENTVVLP